MKQRFQTTNGRIATAQRICRSWMGATNIPTAGAGGGLLRARAKNGDAVTIRFDSEVLDAGRSFLLEIAKITSPDLAVATAEFHRLTEDLGYGSPTPVDRGPRHHVYGDDFFLVVARHTEFHRAPDLSPEAIKRYEPIVKRACRTFFARNTRLLMMHGYEISDLESYAWVWAHIFAHTSELMYVRRDGEPQEINDDDNRRLLTKHLKDQFFHMFTKLRDSSKTVLPDYGTAACASLTEGVVDVWQTPDEEVADQPIAPAYKRRANAQAMLKERLAGLPHEDMVAKLLEQCSNPNRDYATRREARRIVRTHIKGCELCAGIDLGSLSLGGHEIDEGGHEAVAGVHALGVEEGPVSAFH